MVSPEKSSPVPVRAKAPRVVGGSAIALSGPAYVTASAYVDPGNVATNFMAGARYGYLLVWVIVAANVTAMFVQYLSVKLTIATGETLPELCRRRFHRSVSSGLWGQAELVAMATDVAELVGGAVALHLLFGMPLLLGALVTAAVSWIILTVQSRRGPRPFETMISALLLAVLIGFCYNALAAGPALPDLLSGLAPRTAGTDSVVLASAMLGATVMPHAIYMHGALMRDRHGHRLGDVRERRRLLGAARFDVLTGMGLAGLVNLAMLVAAAAALTRSQGASLDSIHTGLDDAVGHGAAWCFALALLASGFASTSVGTYAGSVILEGFMRRRIPLVVRRLVTLVPALGVLAIGVEPGWALVVSQVILSFGIPFALGPVVVFTSQRGLMGPLVNRHITTVVAVVAAGLISSLNLVLIWLTFSGANA